MRPCLVLWALNAPHRTCPDYDKEKMQRSWPQVFSSKQRPGDRFMLRSKASRNVNSNFILTVVVSGLNLTKGLKISIVLLLRGLTTTKAGSFLSSRMLGDFLVQTDISRFRTRCSDWQRFLLKCASVPDLLRDTAFSTFSHFSWGRGSLGCVCVCVFMWGGVFLFSLWHGLLHDITPPSLSTHMLTIHLTSAPITPLEACRWLGTPRSDIYSVKWFIHMYFCLSKEETVLASYLPQLMFFLKWVQL